VQFGLENDGEDELEKDWELKRLYVQQENQNNGIGSRLMDLALNQMKEYQVKRVFLDVWEQNPRAILFYQRFGFEVVGKRKFEVASGAETSADLIMVLSI
jgi:ribosomal protein S18 acetylase RimI-like enzyme